MLDKKQLQLHVHVHLYQNAKSSFCHPSDKNTEVRGISGKLGRTSLRKAMTTAAMLPGVKQCLPQARHGQLHR